MKYFYYLNLNHEPVWFVAKKAEKEPNSETYEIKFSNIIRSSTDLDNLKMRLIDLASDFWGSDRNDPSNFLFHKSSGLIDYFTSDTIEHGLVMFVLGIGDHS